GLATDRGARRARSRRDTVCDRGFSDGWPTRLRRGTWVFRGSRGRAQGERVPPRRARVRTGRRVRPHPQRLRLPSPDLQPPRQYPRLDHDPRLLLAADSSRVPALQLEQHLRRDQQRGPPSNPRLTRDDPPRDQHRGVLSARDTWRLLGYLLFFGRIHPDKGTVEAIEVAVRCGIPLVIAGIVQDQRYF